MFTEGVLSLTSPIDEMMIFGIRPSEFPLKSHENPWNPNVVDLENHQWMFFFFGKQLYTKKAIFFFDGKNPWWFPVFFFFFGKTLYTKKKIFFFFLWEKSMMVSGRFFPEIDPFFIGRHQRCSKCGAAWDCAMALFCWVLSQFVCLGE